MNTLVMPLRPRPSRRQVAASRVRDLLRSAIVHEEFPAGTLPGESRLMLSFSTSRQVVRDALDLLRGEGLLRRTQGAGTHSTAAKVLHDFMYLHGPGEETRTFGYQLLSLTEETAAPRVAARLELPAGSRCGVVEVLTTMDGEPMDVTTVYVRSWMVPAARDVEAVSEWFSLYDGMGVELGTTEHLIEAIVADEFVASQLEVAPGHPLLFFERLVRDADGRPLEYAFTRARGDRLTLTNTLVRRKPVG